MGWGFCLSSRRAMEEAANMILDGDCGKFGDQLE
jgi:hypothetical protein